MKKLLVHVMIVAIIMVSLCFTTTINAYATSSSKSASQPQSETDVINDENSDSSPVDTASAPIATNTKPNKTPFIVIIQWALVILALLLSIAGLVIGYLTITNLRIKVDNIERKMSNIIDDWQRSYATKKHVENEIQHLKSDLIQQSRGIEHQGYNSRTTGNFTFNNSTDRSFRRGAADDELYREEMRIVEERRKKAEEEQERQRKAEEERKRKAEEDHRRKAEMIRGINSMNINDRLRWKSTIGNTFQGVRFVNRAMNGTHTVATEPTDLNNELFAVISPDRVSYYLVPFAGDYKKCDAFYKIPSEVGRLHIEELAEITIDSSSHVSLKRVGVLAVDGV